MTEKRFTKQEVYDGINRYQINDSNFIVEILDDGIPMHYSTIVNRLNKQDEIITRLENENQQLKQSIKEIDNAELHLKQIILKRIDDYIWEWEDEGTPVAQVLRELRDDII